MDTVELIMGTAELLIRTVLSLMNKAESLMNADIIKTLQIEQSYHEWSKVAHVEIAKFILDTP